MIRAVARIVVCLTVAAASVPGQTKKGPERLWTRMDRANGQYDWLRPPDSVLRRVISEVHSGRLDLSTLEFVYKKEPAFFGFDYVFDLRLRTPLGMAAAAASASRDVFAPPPALGDGSKYRNVFLIWLSVNSPERNAVPSVGVAYGDKLLVPSKREPGEPTPAPCRDYFNLRCWLNNVAFTFQVPDGERMTGSGRIVLRWRGEQHVAAINFDHLW